MKIHIVGAGPSGMSLAWEIIHTGDHDVTVYDRKVSAGGSWWEPDVATRDLHAHRMLFDRAFINTRSLFSEMGIQWHDVFEEVSKADITSYVFKSLGLQDYGTLISLFARVLTRPEMYRTITVKDAVGTLSDTGRSLVEHLTLVMDGVTWDVMSAYEFVQNINHTTLSRAYTQKVSGKVMCDAMEEALIDAGVNFIFGTELKDVAYLEDGYEATFSDGRIIQDGYLFLCLDNSPALHFLGDNWGPDADRKVRGSTYGAINVLLDYDEPQTLKTDVEIAATTEWNLQPKLLPDGKTISCVICDLNETILSQHPAALTMGVIEQLGVAQPVKTRIGWGAEWENDTWVFSQSSGVLSIHGQLPFFGKCPKVAMCGMMSPRHTPYSSIEAAVEVSRSLSHQVFGTREPLRPVTLTQVSALAIMVLIVLILVYRNRHQ